jgi:DNA-directed RNA polymerase subunit RPC12/RpoP
MKTDNIITGTVRLKEAIHTKNFGVVYPANGTLNAYCDDRDRIFAEHPKYKGTYIRVYSGNIIEAHWNENVLDNKLAEKDTICKPKFFQAYLLEVKGNVFDHVYPQLKGSKHQFTIVERMENPEGRCSDCGKNHWIIAPKESSIVREGGKPYIECLNCGYITHL